MTWTSDHLTIFTTTRDVHGTLHLNKVAVDDRVAEGRVVHADFGLGRRQVRVKVDADPAKAAEVVERRARLELAKETLEFGLKSN